MTNMIKEGTLKEREMLYRLMISQLFYDGYTQVAMQLSTTVKSPSAVPPSDRLLHLMCTALKSESIEEEGDEGENTEVAMRYVKPVAGIDLDFGLETVISAPEPGNYETVYVTSHKDPCRAGAFNEDGSLVATGSADSSIKILDVEKMIAKSIGAGGGLNSDDLMSKDNMNENQHPVIRTLYDHTDEVTALRFHPTEQLLASGSLDYTIKLYDFAKPAVKRALKTISESAPIRCLSFHPGGQYMLVGTEHPTLRMYNVRTAQCYVAANPDEHHTGSINDLCFAKDGKFYVSCSRDGSIKVWDGVSSRCVCSFSKAHDGAEICSVQISNNGKYILSSGKDSLVKLWELSMTRCLIAYTGAGASGKQVHNAQAVFNHTEDFVLFPDEKSLSLCVWDSRSAQRQKLLSLGHNQPVRYLVHSPTSPAFLTCSDDYRARFWYRKNELI